MRRAHGPGYDVILFGGIFQLIPEDTYAANQIIFWMETLAVESFGFSWLIKGESVFKDPHGKA